MTNGSTQRSAAVGIWRIQRPRHQSAPSAEGYLLLPVVLVIAVVAAVAFLMNRESAIDIRTAGSAAEGDAARYVAEAGLRHALWQANAGACSGYGVPATSFGGHSYQAVLTPDSGSPVSVDVTGTLASGAQRILSRSSVPVHQSPRTEIFQPGASDGRDNYLDEFSNNNNRGSRAELRIRDPGSNNKYRPLLQFDLPGIPAEAKIVRATLELELLYNIDDTSFSVDVHRVTQLWSETGSTWDERDTGQPWTAAGGDFDPNVMTTALVGPAIDVRYPFDLTDLVQGWVSGDYPNYGAILIAHVGLTNAHFATSDHSDASLHPRLTVEWTCECGKVCLPPPSCDADFTPNGSVAQFSTGGQSYRYNRGLTYFPQGQSINGTPAPAGGGWIAVGDTGRLVLLDFDGNILDDGFDTGLTALEGVAFVHAGAKAGQLALVTADSLYFADPTVTPASSSYTTHVLPFVDTFGGVTYIDGGTYGGHLAVADTGNDTIHIFDQSLNLVTTLNTAATLDAPEGIAHMRGTDKFLVVDKNLNAGFVIHTDLTVSQSYDLTPLGWGEPAAAALHPTLCHHVIADHANDRYQSLNAVGGPLDVRVASSSDDAEELMFNNSVDLASTSLELVDALGFTQMVGLRFDNVTVPNGAPITSAWIQFTTAAKDTGPVNLTIRGEAADDAATFAAVSANVSSRPLTAASVPWSPSNWQTVGEAGPNQQTADISPVIQEIVNRPGWTPGNALVIVISGSKTRTAHAFDGDALKAPLLHIEF